MTLDDVMQALGSYLRISDLKSHEDGSFAISFDAVTVTFAAAQGNAFVLRARLGKAATTDFGLLEALMADNLSPLGGGNSALSIDFTNEVFLLQRVNLDPFDFPELIDALERFVTRAEHWTLQLARAADAPTGQKP